MIRVRPQNWNQVLADFRLGWAENNREACLRNLGPLSSVARAFGSQESGVRSQEPGRKEPSSPPETKADKKDDLSRRIHREADRLHTTHFFCPDGGQYRLAPDGKSMMCSIHGSTASPRQPQEPQGALGDLLDRFCGMLATLTFREDGLHATITIERK